MLKSKKKYAKERVQYQMIMQKLAILITGSNVPVENEEFQSLIQTPDCRYDVPPRAQIGREIDQIFVGGESNIQMYLLKVHMVNICADLWMKKGMSSSYLGLIAHFFSRHNNKRHVVTLAVC